MGRAREQGEGTAGCQRSTLRGKQARHNRSRQAGRDGDDAPRCELYANVTSGGDVQHGTRLRVPSEMQIPTRGPTAAAAVSAGTRQLFCTQTSTDLLLVTAAGDTCIFDLRREKQAGGSWSPALPNQLPRQGSKALLGWQGKAGSDYRELGRTCLWKSVTLRGLTAM